jgi:hypothetical protein
MTKSQAYPHLENKHSKQRGQKAQRPSEREGVLGDPPKSHSSDWRVEREKGRGLEKLAEFTALKKF